MGPVQGLDTPAYLVPGIRNWLLILPILTRLYTSVKPLMSEIWASKVSWWTDLSPTTILPWCPDPLFASTGLVAGGGVPGVGAGVGTWEGLYRVLPAYPPRTHI